MRKMVIDKKLKNTPLPVGKPNKRCKTGLIQDVALFYQPVEGAKNTTCPVCDMYVTIPSVDDQIIKQKSPRAKNPNMFLGVTGMNLKPRRQSIRSRGKLVQHSDDANHGSEMNILDSQRIHGRNKLTKYIPSGKIFRSVGYDWNCHMILKIVKNNTKNR